MRRCCWGGGVGEGGGGFAGEAVELGEAGLFGLTVLVPEVELGHVGSEGAAFVCDLGEGVGELGIVDLFTGVAADDGGFFKVELVEAVGVGGALAGVEGRVFAGGGEAALGGLEEPVGVGEEAVDLGPDGGFEVVGWEVAGVVGAAHLGWEWCGGAGALVEAGLVFPTVDAGDGAAGVLNRLCEVPWRASLTRVGWGERSTL
jgi:hypothetical protein